MKQVCGFWLPDDERHLIEFLETGPIVHGGPTYQFRKLKPALELTTRRGLAVDVGAHCGLWSRVLSHEFEWVQAFEPVYRHRECFEMNLRGRDNVALSPYALGDASGGIVTLLTGPASSGDTSIAKGEYSARDHKGHVAFAEIMAIDSLKFLAPIDFLKIDCEGYEYFVIKGGEETIRKSKPTIIVEQKPGHAEKFGLRRTQAVDLLESWGARLRFEMSGDFCLTW